MSLFTATFDSKIIVAQESTAEYPVRSLSPKFGPPTSQYASGTSASQLSLGHMSRQSVGTGTPVSLNVKNGSIDDLLGDPAAFSKIKVIGLYNRGDAQVNVTGSFITSRFGASTSIPLSPGGRFEYDNPSAAGLAVTLTTADTITLTSVSGTNNVDIVLGGCP